MDYHLVCVHPFGKYAKGQIITDDEEAQAVLDDHEHRFVRIAVPAAAPAPVEPAKFADMPDEPVAKAAPEAGDRPWPAPQNEAKPKRGAPPA